MNLSEQSYLQEHHEYLEHHSGHQVQYPPR